MTELEKRLQALVVEFRGHEGYTGDLNLVRLAARIGAELAEAKAEARIAEAIANEREECAELAEAPAGNYQIGMSKLPYWDGRKAADAIRARSNKP